VRNRERGVAAVEAAISLPVLLLLLFAGVELSRAFVQYTVLADASRNAARHVAETAMQATQRIEISSTLITEARNLVVYGNEAGTGTPILSGLTPGEITIADAGNNNVRVTSTYVYQPLFGARLPTFGNGSAPDSAFTMNIAVTMRAL
jgi:Flp pilus assembly protein TadG